MLDELDAAIHAMQGGDAAAAQQAFAAIVGSVLREPADSAAALRQAVQGEAAAGGLCTPRLLTLLGLTHEPAAECLPLCLGLLRAAADTADTADTAALPPTDALLGAAAVVARTQPGALLPDLAALKADPQAAQAMQRAVAQPLLLLLRMSSHFLRDLPDNAVTRMARGLWLDCAAFDLLTLVDFVGLQVERSGADDPLVALMVDLVERLPASADHKRYAGQRLAQAGADLTVVDRLKSAWRAIRVAPVPGPIGAPRAIAEPEPPLSEPRIDDALVVFADGDADDVERARVALDQMFEQASPPPGLAWWAVATVDTLPTWRRRSETDWMLRRLGTLLRQRGEREVVVPVGALQRWLDAPQLLSATGTRIALELLAWQQPGLVVQRYLHRAVSASDETLPTVRHAALLVGGLWRALIEAEPAAVLHLASRWLAFGFGTGAFVELLLEGLVEHSLLQPGLVDTLAASLLAADLPPEVIRVARELLDTLRQMSPHEPPHEPAPEPPL